MRKILVLRGGALGDFIVTLPALALLRHRWPEARIELAGNAAAAGLARARGLLDAVHSQHEAKWSHLYAAGALPESLADWLQDFDLVLNYWPDPEGELARHFPLRKGQEFLAAPAMPERAPAAAHYCELLRRLGLESEKYWFELNPLVATGARESNEANNPLAGARSYTGIHPGSGSVRKNWPVDRWQALVLDLRSPVLLVLGDAEVAAWTGFLREHRADPGITPAVNLPLEDLVTQFARCRRFVGHDSGISHLAAACGVPSLLLFGPTDPLMWAPPTPHVRVLRRGPELGAISVEEVEGVLPP